LLSAVSLSAKCTIVSHGHAGDAIGVAIIVVVADLSAAAAAARHREQQQEHTFQTHHHAFCRRRRSHGSNGIVETHRYSINIQKGAAPSDCRKELVSVAIVVKSGRTCFFAQEIMIGKSGQNVFFDNLK
jgi:hypothetical protein